MKLYEYPKKILRMALLALSAYYILAFVTIALLRITYPFELEWMEGGMLESVRWLLLGNNLYVEPTLEFIPFIYTPLYFYVAAGLTFLLGLDFFTLRAMSFLASLGCMILIALLVKQETDDKHAAIVAAGIYAATYKITGIWFDIARVDSLFLFLMLATAYFLQKKYSSRNVIIAGLLACCAFMTKQNAGIVVVGLGLYMLLGNKQGRWVFVLVGLGSIVGSSLLLNVMSNGWFSYYIFQLPSQHNLLPAEIVRFWTRDIMDHFGASLLLIIMLLSAKVIMKDQKRQSFHLTLLFSLLLVSWSSRLHEGGYVNVLIPAYAGLAILIGIMLSESQKLINTQSLKVKRTLPVIVYGLIISQFYLLHYNPLSCLPSDRDSRNWQQVIEKVRQSGANVFVPYHGYLVARNGGKSYAHAMAVDDILKAQGGTDKNLLINEIKQRIMEQEFSAIVVDDNHDLYFGLVQEELDEYYGMRSAFVENDDRVSWLVTGLTTRPSSILYRTPQYDIPSVKR